MPNHVTNKIRINGSRKQIDEVLSAVSSEGREFDFNKLIPIPNDLQDVTSPSRIVTQKLRDKQLIYLENWRKVNAPNTLKPDLGLTKELQDQYINEYGFDCWYGWSSHNWGTKWNAYDVSIENNGDDDTIVFDTAWSHPVNIIEALSAKFPETLFSIQYADEDTGHNLGQYEIKNGEYTNMRSFISGSDEAIEFACQVKGDDYEQYLEDRWE